MAKIIELQSERTFRLAHDEESFPGWKVGDEVPSPFTGPDGTIYISIGSMIVDEIHHRHGDYVTIVTNYPSIKSSG